MHVEQIADPNDPFGLFDIGSRLVLSKRDRYVLNAAAQILSGIRSALTDDPIGDEVALASWRCQEWARTGGIDL